MIKNVADRRQKDEGWEVVTGYRCRVYALGTAISPQAWLVSSSCGLQVGLGIWAPWHPQNQAFLSA